MSAPNKPSPVPAAEPAAEPAADAAVNAAVSVAPMPKAYGRSVMATAAARFWAPALIFLVIMVVNALIQAVLIIPDVIPNLTSLIFLGLVLLSYVTMLLSLAVVISCGLQAATGTVTFRSAINGARKNFGKYALWTTIWALAITIGLAIYVIPGMLLIVVFPFVPIAAADGQSNPITANFKAIGARKGRFVITLIVSLFWLLMMQIGIGLASWLITGAPASFAGWLFIAFIGSWLVTGWCLLWRSTPVGVELR